MSGGLVVDFLLTAVAVRKPWLELFKVLIFFILLNVFVGL